MNILEHFKYKILFDNNIIKNGILFYNNIIKKYKNHSKIKNIKKQFQNFGNVSFRVVS